MDQLLGKSLISPKSVGGPGENREKVDLRRLNDPFVEYTAGVGGRIEGAACLKS